MFGLYDALPAAKEGGEAKDAKAPEIASGWAQSAKAMQPRKPTPAMAPPPALLRAQHAQKVKVAPRLTASSVASAAAPSVVHVNSTPAPVFSKATGISLSSEVADAYEPSRPNDYEEVLRRRERERKESDERAKMEAMETQRRREDERRREELEQARHNAVSNRGATLNVSGEEAYLRRGRMSAPVDDGGDRQSMGLGSAPGPPDSGGGGGGMSAAERMMKKMGWKEGSGLGKSEQGMTTPLMAKKTDQRSGVIVNAAELSAPANPDTQAEKRQKTGGPPFLGTPTKVLLLRNMVGPGEVDDELEDEVAGEMVKYGQVMRVCIFEVTDPSFPEHEKVRIFIEFQRTEEATRGVVDLDGRFFGGRVVRAGFFDEGRFDRGELAPIPGELD